VFVRRTSFDRTLASTLLVLGTACASTPDVDPAYRPAENVLEVVAVLRAHISDDTYRFEPARDFTGRNVYRSSLLRLENLEKLHSDALRAGHMDGVIAFAKARALERLQAYDLAAESYRLAADISRDLRVEALHSADVCDALYRASPMSQEIERFASPEPEDVTESTWEIAAEEEYGGLDPISVIERFEERVALLDSLEAATEATHFSAVVREEIERADLMRAGYFVGNRKMHSDGEVRAVAELQRVIARHPNSKYFNRHLLGLANLYAELAIEYAGNHPPESLLFDPVRFRDLLEGATRLYEMVANRDGTPEKLEAARRLEAFLAFSIRIDRDRFTP
jgi:tetratricopeptide (TPR) repeat protein